jgi:drug/metabolite transporter (DMT)-like permease
VGLAGVLVLLLLDPRLENPRILLQDLSPLLVVASTWGWALGTLVIRYQPRSGSHLAPAAYQMILGGSGLALIGIVVGESAQLTPSLLTPGAVGSFLYLLMVGSLVGFVTFNWLLVHMPATLVGTHSYINPIVAILVGWLLGGEELTGRIIGGMLLILVGVALVRSGGVRRRLAHAPVQLAVGEKDGPRQADGAVSNAKRNAKRGLEP